MDEFDGVGREVRAPQAIDFAPTGRGPRELEDTGTRKKLHRAVSCVDRPPNTPSQEGQRDSCGHARRAVTVRRYTMCPGASGSLGGFENPTAVRAV